MAIAGGTIRMEREDGVEWITILTSLSQGMVNGRSTIHYSRGETHEEAFRDNV